MAAPVFVPVSMPADMKDQVPGRIVPCLMRSVYMPGFGSVDFHKLAADAFECMMIACIAETGLKLSSTGGNRTHQQCVWAFNERYTATYNPLVNVTSNRRTGPDGRRYWLRRGMFPVAGFTNGVPDSNHAKALANDLAWFVVAGQPLKYVTDTSVTWIDRTNPNKPVKRTGWDWVVANAPSFGLSWEGAKPGEAGWEPHHLRYVAGDKIPARVQAIKMFLAIKSGQ